MREVWLNPVDDQVEDTRPQCNHCNNRHDGSYIYKAWCSPRCSILFNVGQMSYWVREFINEFGSYEKVIRGLTELGWFDGVSESSTNRWLNAIWARMESNRAIIARAQEMENYHDGY